MPAIKEMFECSKCGCIRLPDATKCPRCGLAYDRDGTETTVNNIGYLTRSAGTRETSIEIIGTYYRLTCPHHGRINVRATVAVPTIKCPFC